MLVVEGLSHSLGTCQVLRDIALSLPTGHTLALLGPNGAGKTTLLRLLCGILPVQVGSIRLGERQPGPVGRRSTWRQQVGLLTEAPGLYDLLSVRQNLMLFARLHGLTVVQATLRVETEAAAFGLTARLEHPCGQLSKGLRQRVALARTVLHEPELLLLDEPTSGLDPDSAEQLRDRLRAWRTAGHTIVLTTHDLDEAFALADQVMVLQQGIVRLPRARAGSGLAEYRAALAQLRTAQTAAASERAA